MKHMLIFKNSFLLKSIFVIALFVLVFISSVSYKHTISLSESSDLLDHSYKIQIHLEKLLSYLKDAETGQRGFIISKDTLFLQPYNLGREKVNQVFNGLKTLSNKDIPQKKQLDTLFRLINIRFALLENTLEINSNSVTNAKMLDGNLMKGKMVMDSIRTFITKMIDVETDHFNHNQNKYEHEISFTPLFTLLLLLFSVAIFIISYVKITTDLYMLTQTNEQLMISIESMKHAEIIGEFCISQWDLINNKLLYSDNLYRLLGCEPQSFEPTIENYLKYVHPEDRVIVRDGAEKILNKNVFPGTYRIIRKDGEVRYFISLGKFITVHKNNKTYIGVIKDVTVYNLNNKALEEKNQELEIIIKELESFNHVASHDLQEPLRKIQTFISLISEKEAFSLSETGKEYFEKIIASAIRMRKLIDDLLLFSRTNKTDKVFVKTDCNLLLENVKQELAQTIEEKNAVIQSTQLPILEVIPFQIQQLFANLIGNALKYCKPNISPIINIGCIKITARDYPILKTDNDKMYFKITVTDNGLGFEQQYTEDIFVLFHQLPHKREYPGSGIGLSICKKIVENHNGFITANGKPGIGATFSVFLPA